MWTRKARDSCRRLPCSITKFSIRFLEGEETAIVPFVEFGHRVIRVRFNSKEGVSLLADYESMKIAEEVALVRPAPSDLLKSCYFPPSRPALPLTRGREWRIAGSSRLPDFRIRQQGS